MIISKPYTKSSVGQHRSPTKAKEGAGAMEEKASSADQSHPHRALVEILGIQDYPSSNPAWR
jgi:hypothetical protein